MPYRLKVFLLMFCGGLAGVLFNTMVLNKVFSDSYFLLRYFVLALIGGVIGVWAYQWFLRPPKS